MVEDEGKTNERKGSRNLPKLSDVAEQVARELEGPISVDEFIERVLTSWPSQAKSRRQSVRQTLMYRLLGRTVAALDKKTVVPLSLAMRGVRFRIPIARQQAETGMLPLEPRFACFVGFDSPKDDIQLLDQTGQPLPVRLSTIKQPAESWVTALIGPKMYDTPAFDLQDWFRSRKVRRGDSLLVTIEDWNRGLYRLEHEPEGRRQRAEIQRKNQEFAALLFDLLESDRGQRLFAYQAIPNAYLRLSDARGYPGDHPLDVIEKDGRMMWDGVTIGYADSPSPLQRALGGGAWPAAERISREQARQAYIFKATLVGRPDIWRRIAIRGGQTLVEFDDILRDAFEHDMSDHLGGFWKIVRRGKSRRVREIDLGDVDPLGEGDGAEVQVAGIGLTAGDTLKYVYDFGDWIEHELTLEEIVEPQKGKEYPAILGQNTPQYQICSCCAQRGRSVVAVWRCIECSRERRQDVVVCEKCLLAEHEGHYAEEMLY